MGKSKGSYILAASLIASLHVSSSNCKNLNHLQKLLKFTITFNFSISVFAACFPLPIAQPKYP